MLQSSRLVLRAWDKRDADDLYKYAKDPRIGSTAGWPPHTSVQFSREVIQKVLSAPETYALEIRGSGKPIGCISLIFESTTMPIRKGEAELGYWLGVPFWGKGLMPEAVRTLLKHAFDNLHLTGIWCGYYDGNEQSKRVQQKCGFVYHHTEENVFCKLIGEYKTVHISYLSAQEYQKLRRSL